MNNTNNSQIGNSKNESKILLFSCPGCFNQVGQSFFKNERNLKFICSKCLTKVENSPGFYCNDCHGNYCIECSQKKYKNKATCSNCGKLAGKEFYSKFLVNIFSDVPQSIL